MKHLLVLLVVVMAVGIWRSKRRAVVAEQTRPASTPSRLQTMVVCAHSRPSPAASRCRESDASRQRSSAAQNNFRRLGPARHFAATDRRMVNSSPWQHTAIPLDEAISRRCRTPVSTPCSCACGRLPPAAACFWRWPWCCCRR